MLLVRDGPKLSTRMFTFQEHSGQIQKFSGRSVRTASRYLCRNEIGVKLYKHKWCHKFAAYINCVPNTEFLKTGRSIKHVDYHRASRIKCWTPHGRKAYNLIARCTTNRFNSADMMTSCDGGDIITMFCNLGLLCMRAHLDSYKLYRLLKTQGRNIYRIFFNSLTRVAFFVEWFWIHNEDITFVHQILKH